MNKADQFETATLYDDTLELMEAELDDENSKLTPLPKARYGVNRSRINHPKNILQTALSLSKKVENFLANFGLYPREEESLCNYSSHLLHRLDELFHHLQELQTKLHALRHFLCVGLEIRKLITSAKARISPLWCEDLEICMLDRENSVSYLWEDESLCPKQLKNLQTLRCRQYEWGTPKSDYSLGKILLQNQVKPLGYCCKDEWLVQKENLKNQFLRSKNVIGCAEYIEQSSWRTRYEIVLGVAQVLDFIHNSEKKYIYKDFKPSNILLIDETTHNSIEKVNAMDAGQFTALDVSSFLKLYGKTGMEIKESRFGDEDEAEKEYKWRNQPSHSQNNWPNMKTKNESQSNVFPLLLLIIATLLSTITFLTALKIRGCRSEEGYEYNSSLNPICRIVNHDPLIVPFVIAFNSVAFFLSIALMMIHFNELPLRPLLLVSAFSMLSAYMCAISGTLKPLRNSS